MPPDRTRVPPRFDTLDDEEAFARLDEAEAPRLAHEGGVRRGVGELPLQSPPLRAQRPDVAVAPEERAMRVDVRAEGPVVEKRD
jgi:hypothetical protein